MRAISPPPTASSFAVVANTMPISYVFSPHDSLHHFCPPGPRPIEVGGPSRTSCRLTSYRQIMLPDHKFRVDFRAVFFSAFFLFRTTFRVSSLRGGDVRRGSCTAFECAGFFDRQAVCFVFVLFSLLVPIFSSLGSPSFSIYFLPPFVFSLIRSSPGLETALPLPIRRASPFGEHPFFFLRRAR